jgi:hypothetical protein
MNLGQAKVECHAPKLRKDDSVNKGLKYEKGHISYC